MVEKDDEYIRWLDHLLIQMAQLPDEPPDRTRERFQVCRLVSEPTKGKNVALQLLPFGGSEHWKTELFLSDYPTR